MKKLLVGSAVVLSAMAFVTMSSSKNMTRKTDVANCSSYYQDTVPKKPMPDTSKRPKRDTPPSQKEQ